MCERDIMQTYCLCVYEEMCVCECECMCVSMCVSMCAAWRVGVYVYV